MAGDRPTVLIANRGEIARRVIRTCKKLNVDTVAVFTSVDALSPHVREATHSVFLGNKPREYTNAQKLLQVALDKGCTAVHPGYGFLSENVDFCEAMTAAGITWLGPTSKTMHDFALKHVARELASNAGVPVLPGTGLLQSSAEAVAAAEQVGYPVLLKATGGGGGMGIFICHNKEDIMKQFETSQHQGQAFFGNSGVFLEKYIERAHHVEVQIFGDGTGGCIHLGERECSIQRRHQKVLEETPSPLVDQPLRNRLTLAAVQLGSLSCYRSAGTVEFLVDEDTSSFYFLEVNTRLQVEHGITELVHNSIDIVEAQLRLQVPQLQPAGGPQQLLATLASVPRSGWAIEVRINGEDPVKEFRPCPGEVGLVEMPTGMDGVRMDTWVETGTQISPYYDSLLGKLMVHAPTRAEAIEKMAAALERTQILGAPNNLEFLRALVQDERFKGGHTTTRFLEGFKFVPHVMEVVSPGMQTSVQDWPGRVGLWHVGVPPSGPMDSLSFRLANALVGNDETAAGLEFSLTGPVLRFHCPALVALCGAQFSAELDGEPITWWSSFKVAAGQTLTVAAIQPGTSGVRGYLAVKGGVDVPPYLGSRATFPSGRFGGYQGRYLRAGDSLPIGHAKEAAADARPTALPEELVPMRNASQQADGTTLWEVGVLPGPHADPDYLTTEYMQTFHATPWKVHYNSNRLGIRLSGPKPGWVRSDGGDGGSHPSNVHDHVYAIGAINFTGDHPVVLTVDGPSLGGFVCAVTIVSTELWKMGQVKPDDGVLFKLLTLEESFSKILTTDAQVAAVRELSRSGSGSQLAALKLPHGIMNGSMPQMPPTKALLKRVEAQGSYPGAEYRLAGDRYLQVEYGPMELDINLRVRVHCLEAWLHARKLRGLLETSPGVRSCMIEYDMKVLPLVQLLQLLEEAEAQLPAVEKMVLPSRVVHLPMAFDERWTHDAIAKYMKSIRLHAPYLPSNIEYIAANNGLQGGKQEVQQSIFSSSYLVLGLGDVYLGAPCAVPMDPRQRLVTTKYNPARTFTAEGTVGIGGSYMCIYPMDSPGGYQLVGRTLPIWNTFARAGPFTRDKPWLLEFFDQVRFFLVSEPELEDLRERFQTGRYSLKIEDVEFNMQQYNSMVAGMQQELQELKAQQRAAMAVQLQKETESLAALAAQQKQAGPGSRRVTEDEDDDSIYDKPGLLKVLAPFSANVWDIKVELGAVVKRGDLLLVLEAMKMESPVIAPLDGKVIAIKAQASQLTSTGTLLVVLEAVDELEQLEQ